jgi:conjugative transfer signal peptidase TraF
MRLKLIPYLISLLIVFIYYCLLKIFNIAINYTGSMPIGFYKKEPRTEIKRGDIVSVCLPKSVAQYGFKRGYLDKGDCLDGVTAPVLKQVIAVPHDTVELTNQAIIVNGTIYFASYQASTSLTILSYTALTAVSSCAKIGISLFFIRLLLFSYFFI